MRRSTTPERAGRTWECPPFKPPLAGRPDNRREPTVMEVNRPRLGRQRTPGMARLGGVAHNRGRSARCGPGRDTPREGRPGGRPMSLRLCESIRGERFAFADLRDLFARANEAKSGDALAGLAARSDRERVAAKRVLAGLTLREVVEH